MEQLLLLLRVIDSDDALPPPASRPAVGVACRLLLVRTAEVDDAEESSGAGGGGKGLDRDRKVAVDRRVEPLWPTRLRVSSTCQYRYPDPIASSPPPTIDRGLMMPSPLGNGDENC